MSIFFFQFSFIRIDGKTAPEQRKHFVDKFQQSDDVLAAVLSITAANAGLNLTAAKLVLFAELSWNPGVSIRKLELKPFLIICIEIIDYSTDTSSSGR